MILGITLAIKGTGEEPSKIKSCFSWKSAESIQMDIVHHHHRSCPHINMEHFHIQYSRVMAGKRWGRREKSRRVSRSPTLYIKETRESHLTKVLDSKLSIGKRQYKWKRGGEAVSLSEPNNDIYITGEKRIFFVVVD